MNTSVHIANNFLVIPGKALIRVGTIISVASQTDSFFSRKPAVEIRHGGKGFSSPSLTISCESFDAANALQVEIEKVLTHTKTREWIRERQQERP